MAGGEEQADAVPETVVEEGAKQSELAGESEKKTSLVKDEKKKKDKKSKPKAKSKSRDRRDDNSKDDAKKEKKAQSTSRSRDRKDERKDDEKKRKSSKSKPRSRDRKKGDEKKEKRSKSRSRDRKNERKKSRSRSRKSRARDRRDDRRRRSESKQRSRSRKRSASKKKRSRSRRRSPSRKRKRSPSKRRSTSRRRKSPSRKRSASRRRKSPRSASRDRDAPALPLSEMSSAPAASASAVPSALADEIEAAAARAALRRKSKWDEAPSANTGAPILESVIAVPKPPPPGPERQKTMKLEAVQIRVLIGKGGENIKALRAESGTDIRVEHDHQSPEGTVTMNGDVEKAEQMIRNHLLSKGCPLVPKPPLGPPPPPPALPPPVIVAVAKTEVSVPQELVWPLIGPGGSNLKDVRNQAGAVFISVLPPSTPGAAQLVRITGDNRDLAASLIQTKIEVLHQRVAEDAASGLAADFSGLSRDVAVLAQAQALSKGLRIVSLKPSLMSRGSTLSDAWQLVPTPQAQAMKSAPASGIASEVAPVAPQDFALPASMQPSSAMPPAHTAPWQPALAAPVLGLAAAPQAAACAAAIVQVKDGVSADVDALQAAGMGGLANLLAKRVVVD